jgi:hypothetical protein
VRRLIYFVAGTATLVCVTAWLFAPETTGVAAPAAYLPHPPPEWPLPGDGASANDLRNDAFRRARTHLDPVPELSLEDVAFSAETPPSVSDLPGLLECRYLYDEPSGTSSKFDCVLANGQIVKVKYGRNSEIHAEAAASALLARLGYATDRVRIVPRVRCYGCPRYPFLMSQLLFLAGLPDPLDPDGYDSGYTDFDWVSVESRFDAPVIETADVEGWAWYELAHSRAPRADLDAFRLLAVFLAHWDNKADNQRLVCMDAGPAPADGVCALPLLMIQDTGATFGPVKVNLSAWRDRPIWEHPDECRVTMRDLPFSGATFPDAQIGEAGRLEFARRISSLTDDEVRRMFVEARFPEFYSGTDDAEDLTQWAGAFRRRVDQVISAGPCPN